MLTRGLTALALLAVAHLAAAAALQPGDSTAPPEVPPVFRCIFEDRSRMVIIHPPGSDLWVAFNPGTCGIQKIWRGGMDFRGKVWDFSQDNCQAASGARVMAVADSILIELGETDASSSQWEAQDVELSGTGSDLGWVFRSDGSTLTSPVFDASDRQRVFVAFDERSRAGSFRIDISADGGATWEAQSFHSTMHGTSDTDWQFNFKLVEHPTTNMRIRVTQERAADQKQIRRLRVFGDRSAWSLVQGDRETSLWPVWRGYDRRPYYGFSCVLEYDLLIDGAAVAVQERWSAGSQLLQRLKIGGIKPGVVVRYRPARVADSAPFSLGVPWDPDSLKTTSVTPRFDLGAFAFDITGQPERWTEFQFFDVPSRGPQP